jgi:hypothetical protein
VIRVVLPVHLRTLARVNREIALSVDGAVTLGAVLDELETQYPVLTGTIRDRTTRQRRPFIRYFACGQDFSLEALEVALPEPVALGQEPLRIVGAMAGG